MIDTIVGGGNGQHWWPVADTDMSEMVPGESNNKLAGVITKIETALVMSHLVLVLFVMGVESVGCCRLVG